ncbi:hypothetical protein E2562_028022 [Oryza meyeriana var. granulata]|uniref:Uncharacterized protein n=1 Tax=Oryza meyeriana var. granulata TaxID=110450 RepID=A0A6G1BZM8_9ORYZ|nr:hypothetical protein E2562_028022 [Oryza meyeriana var. granulata]
MVNMPTVQPADRRIAQIHPRGEELGVGSRERMGVRRSACALSREEGESPGKRRRKDGEGSPEVASDGGGIGAFGVLHNELVVSILADVAAFAGSPTDLATAMLTGLPKDGRNLQAGAQLYARATSRGRNDTLHELGHCVSDGYDVRHSLSDG